MGEKKLGFGLMRLPKKGFGIDVAQTSQMVDRFMEAGFTYFDTAFVYQGSEEAARQALVERYPRDSYTIASKLFATFSLTEAQAKKELTTSLKRLGTDHLDYYLLHSLMESNYKKYGKFDLWNFVKEQKELGTIRHYGFSFHGGPKLLDELLTEHPDVDFVQLQINYADWENPKIRSREVYEVARAHGKQIVIMEPVKGGALANPPEEVKQIFNAVHPGASYASWAIRFAASLDGVLAVLSGMSNIGQMEDNLSYMKDFRPLDEKEMEAIAKAQKVFYEQKTIGCTACGYCKAGCPKQIAIPDIFAARNIQLGFGQIEKARAQYQRVTLNQSRASDCIGCRMCESICPQKLEIPRLLAECAETYED